MSSFTPVATMPKASTLVITRRTVKVGDHVYPLANICHFGPGMRMKKLVPWRFLCVIAAIGLFFTNFGSTRPIGTLLVVGTIALFTYDQVKGRKFGLMLMLNSGKELFFETTDSTGIAAVADNVYAMLERVDGETEPKQVTVNQNKITITDTTITGGFNTGTISGDMRTEMRTEGGA